VVQRIFPRRRLPEWQGLLLAVVVAALAWLLRSALAPVLRDQMPYTLFILAVLVASIFGGWKSGVVATALSGFVANFSFGSPGEDFNFQGSRGWGFCVFILVSLLLVALVNALAATLRRETALREDLTTVSGEYRHRIKNLLTVTQSLVHQTGRTAGSVSEFKEKVLDRLQALARAQDLLQIGKGQAAPLRELIEEILKPFHIEARLAWPISSPDVLVPAEMTTALALLLNELATNAVKYGALSVPDGRLKIGWTVQAEWTVIEWKEIDGPHVAPPEKLGFGSRLFDNALPRGSGSTELRFEPNGLRCEIKLRTSGI
jgi:two-component sensor histidine kinase